MRRDLWPWLSLVSVGVLSLIVGCRSGWGSAGATITTDPATISSDAHPTLEATDPFEREMRKAVGREAARQARLRAVRRENREIADRWRAEAPERLRNQQQRVDEPEPGPVAH